MTGAGWDVPYAENKMPGRVFAPNLTPDPDTGLGAVPDDAIARAIREGVGHDGRALFMMPSKHFRNLSDEEVASIVVFLRSLPPVKKQRELTQIQIPVRWFMKFGPKPLTAPVPEPVVVEPEPSVEDAPEAEEDDDDNGYHTVMSPTPAVPPPAIQQDTPTPPYGTPTPTAVGGVAIGAGSGGGTGLPGGSESGRRIQSIFSRNYITPEADTAERLGATALAHCWVRGQTKKNAFHVAIGWISEDGWVPTELVEQRAVTRDDFEGTEDLSYFEQALTDGEVFKFEIDTPE